MTLNIFFEKLSSRLNFHVDQTISKTILRKSIHTFKALFRKKRDIFVGNGALQVFQ
jgi:hypothetical protein